MLICRWYGMYKARQEKIRDDPPKLYRQKGNLLSFSCSMLKLLLWATPSFFLLRMHAPLPFLTPTDRDTPLHRIPSLTSRHPRHPNPLDGGIVSCQFGLAGDTMFSCLQIDQPDHQNSYNIWMVIIFIDGQWENPWQHADLSGCMKYN